VKTLARENVAVSLSDSAQKAQVLDVALRDDIDSAEWREPRGLVGEERKVG